MGKTQKTTKILLKTQKLAFFRAKCVKPKLLNWSPRRTRTTHAHMADLDEMLREFAMQSKRCVPVRESGWSLVGASESYEKFVKSCGQV